MKFITNIIVLLITLASVVRAIPRSFSFNGDKSTARDGSCETWWLYYTATDTAGKESTGYFQVDDCLNSNETLGDGTYTLYLNPDMATAILTDYSTGAKVYGYSYSWYEGLDESCDPLSCPMTDSATMTCFYGGGGPDVVGYAYPTGHCGGHTK